LQGGLFGSAAVFVNLDMASKHSHVSADPAEEIIHTALAAFGRGAGRVSMGPPAVQSFREAFMTKVDAALERPDWHDHWHREKVYVVAYAEAMGQRARRLAALDRRSYITPQDITEATHKLRGCMPVAGRWCPL
jgi:hypothetical protein